MCKKYICLRDDDTNYHTRPDELINAYGEFWGKIPITLATVPFSHGSQQKVIECEKYGKERDRKHREWIINASAEELTEYHRTWPIGLNKELVTVLKSMVADGSIEIAQHGVHHAYNERGPEMFSNETGYEAIRDGKEYLEKVFDTKVITFVPPSNTIDVTCVGYLKKLRMHLLSSGVIIKDNVNIPTRDIHSYYRAVKHRLFGQPILPMINNYGIMQMHTHTFGINTDEDVFFKTLEKDLLSTGFTGMGTHYLIFDKTYRERYRSLICRLLDEMDVEFVTAKDYYNHIWEKYYE